MSLTRAIRSLRLTLDNLLERLEKLISHLLREPVDQTRPKLRDLAAHFRVNIIEKLCPAISRLNQTNIRAARRMTRSAPLA